MHITKQAGLGLLACFVTNCREWIQLEVEYPIRYKIPLIVKNSQHINKTGPPNLYTMMFIMNQLPIEEKQSCIVVVGGDPSLHYLLQRYAERAGYSVGFEKGPSSAHAIQQPEPVAVIFPSVEILEDAQALVAELTNYDIPIIVFSSVLDLAKTRKLGADYCLLHPLEFDSFSDTIKAAASSRPKTTQFIGKRRINPV